MNRLQQEKSHIILLFIIVGIIYVIKLYTLQISSQIYEKSATNNSQRIVTKYPSRGLIYDRNDHIMVYNKTAYDLMVVPIALGDIDTTSLCNMLKISIEEFTEKLKEAIEFSPYKPSLFYRQLPFDIYVEFIERGHNYLGFFIQTRSLREYSSKIAANILGYVSEVTTKIVKKDDYYKQGDYVGLTGIEKYYEKELRGEQGINYLLVDVYNRVRGAYQEGKYDKPSVAGKNIKITIDKALQEYGESLMRNKIGSVVAIEPKTGEILSMISSPSYSPKLMVGTNRNIYYPMLIKDSLKPFFNRATMAQYPPGSTFKIINALIALQEEIITPASRFNCNYGFHVRNLTVRCHKHSSPANLVQSIQYSCNSYYCNVFLNTLRNNKYKNIQARLNKWSEYVRSLGLGTRFNKERVKDEATGLIPDAKYYNKRLKSLHWKSLQIVSLAIGQGEILTTPLQLANLAAIVANKGYYYLPHLIKSIDEKNIPEKFKEKRITKFDVENFIPIIEGMKAVVQKPGGTAGIANIPDISVCGKTGTAENPHGEDHSLFIAFAPEENPKIAIAICVENGGYGARWAAPIASLMIEKYLKKEINRKALEESMLNGNLINSNE